MQAAYSSNIADLAVVAPIALAWPGRSGVSAGDH
jgi:hypothetical protein